MRREPHTLITALMEAEVLASTPPDGRRVLRDARMNLHACLQAASRQPKTGYGSRNDRTAEERREALGKAVEEARQALTAWA